MTHESRLDRLEHRQQTLSLALIVCVCSIAILLIGGAGRQSVIAGVHQDVVRAKTIEILDADGKKRIVLSVGDAGPTIALVGDGESKIMLLAAADQPSVSVWGSEGGGATMATSKRGEGAIRLANEAGQERVVLQALDKTGTLTIYAGEAVGDPVASRAVTVASMDNSGFISLFDADLRERIAIQATAERPSVTIYDEQENVAASLPGMP